MKGKCGMFREEIPPLRKSKGPDKIVVTDWPSNNESGSLGASTATEIVTLSRLPSDGLSIWNLNNNFTFHPRKGE